MTKSKKQKTVNVKKMKQSSLLMKILEIVIVIGALAGVVLKLFGGEKKK